MGLQDFERVDYLHRMMVPRGRDLAGQEFSVEMLWVLGRLMCPDPRLGLRLVYYSEVHGSQEFCRCCHWHSGRYRFR